MYVTTHPLSRVMPARFMHTSGWPSSVLAALPQTPVAHWAASQIGSSTGYLVAVWADAQQAEAAVAVETSTPERVVVKIGRSHRVHGVRTAPNAGALPGVIHLASFAGPRSEAQLRADELSDRRVTAALQDLPGLCGALLCYSAGGDYLTMSFADTEATMTAAMDRIMSTVPGPDEDPALLTGPDDVRACEVKAGSGTLRTLAELDATVGGVR